MNRILKVLLVFVYIFLASIFISPNNSDFIHKELTDIQLITQAENTALDVSLLQECPTAYISSLNSTQTEISNNRGKNKNLGLCLSENYLLKYDTVSKFIFSNQVFSYKYIIHKAASFLEYVIITRAP